ncbi:MAG: phosphoribosylaminoimidazolesuccinocarboxamide synthase [Candidatus Paceibacterota bacterium]|jgi:phosphoribosylaminoimidazole-succinocarboxamide synthase
MNKELIEKHINDVIKETNFSELGEKKTGKVRDVYSNNGKLILIATDRHSSFDRNIAYIPFKGEILNQISVFWFKNTSDIIKNHLISIPDPNVLIAKKCSPIPIECVVRGYITGVTDTSLWTHYKNGKRNFGNFVLPEGLRKNQKLPEPLFTPTTKSDEHDRPITPKEIVSEGILSRETTDLIEKISKELFVRGQEIALSHGLILVDTKYEFGFDENNNLTLIDEIHTPDSSRYWKADSYEKLFTEEKEPEYFDKEFLRLWFKENCDPYHDETLPKAPDELVVELSRRYIEIYEMITGSIFDHDFSLPAIERIRNNIKGII